MQFEVGTGSGSIAAMSRDRDEGALLFLAHATGFCKEVWEPFAGVLHDLLEVGLIAWDSRAHGRSDFGEPPFDWWDFGSDALAVVDAAPQARHVGIGHSMGGAALVLAELERPGTFEALVLIEPIMFPPPFERVDHALVASALRRRASFASPAKAFENFACKPAFARWVDGALAAYVRGGLQEQEEDWVLRCRPEHEADIYRGGSAHGAYARLSEVGCPVLLVAGAESDTHPVEFIDHLASQFADVAVRIVEGAGHFLPMEQPDVVAGVVADFLAPVLELPSGAGQP